MTTKISYVLAAAGCMAALVAFGANEAKDCCTPPNFPLPEFKPAKFNVRDFGATGNGRNNDTASINRAIEKCNASGGKRARKSMASWMRK